MEIMANPESIDKADAMLVFVETFIVAAVRIYTVRSLKGYFVVYRRIGVFRR